MNTNMKNARQAAGLSQKEVAITLGVSAPTVSDWESGNTTPTAKNLKQLSRLYGVPIDYLLETHGMLAAYIKQRRKRDGLSIESFAEKCGVDPYIIAGIENGFDTTSARQSCLGTDDLRALANGLNSGADNNTKVDFWYLACLYDGVNPHRVKGLSVPKDDLTGSLPMLLDIKLDLFSATKNAPSVTDEALKLAKDYDKLDAWSQKAVRGLADNELARSNAQRSAVSGIQPLAARRDGGSMVAGGGGLIDGIEKTHHDPTEA